VTQLARRIAERFTRLPIRWRLAVTSAGLTFLILLAFAVVIGAFTARQVHHDFDDDLRATAADIQGRIHTQEQADGSLHLVGDIEAIRAAAAGSAVLRVIATDGTPLPQFAHTADLGPPADGIHDFGRYRVVSRPVYIQQLPHPVVYVQYAKPRASVNGTIARVRLFLTAGVLGGALLALLAGLAVAGRAMGPVQRLTLAAREIARTRDAAVNMPIPAADDEVADLARTLEEMLRELDAARAELEATLTRQREFVADASHELRTPLTSILANLELLEAALEGEDAEIVQSALRSSRRMRGLVSDLLLLARADAPRERTSELVDVSEVVMGAAAEATPLAGGHDLSVDVPGRVMIEGRRDDLHRLVLNLVENALRHTPLETAVRVRVRDMGESVELVVEDEGPGLPPRIRERAFERFVRGGGDGGRGSGLGLSIVQAVTQNHGGQVTYESGERGGAKFVVRLPSFQLPTPSPGSSRPRPQQAESSAGA
jgi:two-component system OmpR family sensor kinase